MNYRFRKILERPDWSPQMGVLVEVTYDYNGTAGGRDPLSSVLYEVVAVRGPLGQYHQPAIFPVVANRLYAESTLPSELLAAARDDYAQRTAVTLCELSHEEPK